MQMPIIKPLVVGALGAVGALVLSLLLYHAYIDHANLHALVNLVQQAQQQKGPDPQPALPTPAPPK